MSGISFSGLASGLPAGLVDQLVELERAPITRFQQRIAGLRSADQAWAGIVTKMSALRTATDDVMRPSAWSSRWTASSSDATAVAVTRTAETASDQSLDVKVLALAQRQSTTNGDRFDGAAAVLGGRTLRIGGVEVTSTDGTVGGLVAAIEADPSLGVSARLAQVEPGSYQLQLTAAASGTANAFAVDGDGWTNPFTDTQQAADAVLELDGLQVTRSSNVVDDLVDGVSLALRATTATPVTIDVTQDVEASAEAVTAFVDALNGVLDEISRQTRYDPSRDSGSALTGDPTARRLASQLTDALLRAADGGGLRTSDVGIRITREGRFALDHATLSAALADDHDAVAALFARATTSSSSADLTVADVAIGTASGEHQVTVDAVASQAQAVGSTGAAPAADELLTITSGGRTASTSILAGTDLADAIAQINGALAAAGIADVAASDLDGRLAITSVHWGSRTVEITSGSADHYGVAGTHTGADAVVTVGGVSVTGDGRTVHVADGAAAGLTLHVTATAPTSVAVTVAEGLGGLMDRTLSDAEGRDGSVAVARQFIEGRIGDLEDRIDVFERRVSKREETLRRQFAALEVMIGQMNSTSQWLSQQLAGLPRPSSS